MTGSSPTCTSIQYSQDAARRRVPKAAVFLRCKNWGIAYHRAHELSDESSNEAHLRALECAFHSQAHFDRWVTRTALNWTVDRLRASRKWISLIEHQLSASRSSDAEDHAVELKRLEAAIAQLEDRERELIRHYYFDSCTLDVLARLHTESDGSSDNARRLRVKREKDLVLRKLRALLDGQ